MAVENVKCLWNKALGCGRFYGERILKGLFIGALLESIRCRIRSYWIFEKSATVHNLAHNAKSSDDLCKCSDNDKENGNNAQMDNNMETTAAMEPETLTISRHFFIIKDITVVYSFTFKTAAQSHPMPSEPTFSTEQFLATAYSAMSLDNDHFCCVGRTSSPVTTQCPVVLLQVQLTLMGMLAVNLPSLPTCQWWRYRGRYCGSLTPRTGGFSLHTHQSKNNSANRMNGTAWNLRTARLVTNASMPHTSTGN